MNSKGSGWMGSVTLKRYIFLTGVSFTRWSTGGFTQYKITKIMTGNSARPFMNFDFGTIEVYRVKSTHLN